MVKLKIDGESKKDRFKRLATSRTNAVIERIRILSNCSNQGLYDYSDEDIKEIFKAIENELKIGKSRFIQHSKDKFSLD